MLHVIQPALSFWFGSIAAGPSVPLDPPPVAASVVGVLGLRDAHGTLSTLRVDEVDGFSFVGDGVYVPRAEGWWWLQTGTSSVSPGISSAWTVAAPLTSGAHVAVPVPEAWCPGPVGGGEVEGLPEAGANRGEARDEVVFVGPDVVSIEHRGEVSCEGLRPWGWADLDTGRLSDGVASEPLSLAAALPGASDAFLAANDQAYARRLEAGACLDENTDQWGLVRREGRWVVRGRLQTVHEGCDIRRVDFSVPAASASAITGPDRLPVPYDVLARAHPGLLDAVASPDGRLLVLIDAGGLSLLLDGAEVDRVRFADSALVMAQWATGRGAQRWAAPDSPVVGVPIGPGW